MTRRPLLYVIGPSGSGKSTLVRHLLGDLTRAELKDPIGHILYRSGAIQLGTNRTTFSGTDALPLNVNPKAIRFIQETSAPAVIAEGDRLANDKFFDAAIKAGWDLTIVYLSITDDECARRRSERHHAMSPSFVKGRATKSVNLYRRWQASANVLILNANRAPEDIARELTSHPAVRIARGG
jgi:energy-coupling factor transporter ATP-binding protein EcfA2